MWTIDTTRCPACPQKEQCADRKKLVQALSELALQLNTDPAHVDGPGDGAITIICREQF